MISIEEAIKQFEKLPEEIVIEFSSKRFIERLTSIEKKCGIDLSTVVILIAINELTEESASLYLVSEHGLHADEAEKAIKDLFETTLNPIIARLNLLNPSLNKTKISTQEEADMLIGIFRDDLMHELDNHPIILAAVNARIFYVLARDSHFKKELESAFYQNNQMLGKTSFKSGDKLVTPTIANWINDFIKLEGTGNITKLNVSHYLANSFQVKNLNPDERDLLFKVLFAYYAIKYFPDSMPSDDGSGWEILPTNDENLTINDAREIKHDEGESKKLRELREIAEQFAPGSLERRVVDEEIRKLSS